MLCVATLLFLQSVAGEIGSLPVPGTTSIDKSPAPSPSNERSAESPSPSTRTSDDEASDGWESFDNFGLLTHTISSDAESDYCYLPPGILFNRMTTVDEYDVVVRGSICGFCHLGGAGNLRKLLLATSFCFTGRLSRLMKVSHNLYIAAGASSTQVIAVDCGLTDPKSNTCDLRVLIGTLDRLTCTTDYVFIPTSEQVVSSLNAAGVASLSTTATSCSSSGQVFDENFQLKWMLGVTTPTSTNLFRPPTDSGGRQISFQECSYSSQGIESACLGNISLSLETSCHSAISHKHLDSDTTRAKLTGGNRRKDLNRVDSQRMSPSYGSDSLGTKDPQANSEPGLPFVRRSFDGGNDHPEVVGPTLRNFAFFRFIGSLLAEAVLSSVIEGIVELSFGSSDTDTDSSDIPSEWVTLYDGGSSGFVRSSYNFAKTPCRGVYINGGEPLPVPPEPKKGWFIFPAGWSTVSHVFGMIGFIIALLIALVCLLALCNNDS